VSDVDALNAYLLLSPLHQWLGCRIASHDEAAGAVEVLLPDKPELHRGAGSAVAHGGVVAALVDIAAHAALHAKTGHGSPTVDVKIDYLRLATLPLTARATVRRNGQNVGFADVEIMDCDGKLAALGRAVFFTRIAAPSST
jgi:uncharacterized protein (TIGR00369 family)